MPGRLGVNTEVINYFIMCININLYFCIHFDTHDTHTTCSEVVQLIIGGTPKAYFEQ